MPVDAFMYFKPATSGTGAVVEGESTDDQPGVPKDQKLKPFEIISFEWGAYIGKKEQETKTTTDSTGAPGTAPSPPPKKKSETTAHREVTVDNFKISKPFDSASCGLFMATINPKCVFDEAVVIFRKSGGGEPFVYLKFVFRQVQIDSVEWKIEAADGGDKPDQEDVKMSFQECDIFYSPQAPTGVKQLSFAGSQKKTGTYKRSELDGEAR